MAFLPLECVIVRKWTQFMVYVRFSEKQSEEMQDLWERLGHQD